MANPQPSDAHLRIAHSIQEEIMMRDFTKRQRSILDLILRLSWGCGKKIATITRQKDFELVGIAKTKIKEELNWLVNARVITWTKTNNEYSFNKDYDSWKVSIVPGYNRQRLNELIHININSSQNGNIVPKAGTSQNGNKVDEKGTKFPSRGELSEPTIPSGTSISGQSIKSNIESNNIYTSDFEKFYQEYPRPEDKRRTFNNWKTCLKTYTVDQLMAACRNYKAAKAGTERQYLKSSANFLGREKPFEDYIKSKEHDSPKKAVNEGVYSFD